MKSYKSVNNSNVKYIPVSVSSSEKINELNTEGVKMTLKKVLSIKKKFNVLWLFSIPYTKKVKEILIYLKPNEGEHSNKWLLLRKNYKNLKNSSSRFGIKYKVKSKKFTELLNKIQSNEKSSKSST